MTSVKPAEEGLNRQDDPSVMDATDSRSYESSTDCRSSSSSGSYKECGDVSRAPRARKRKRSRRHAKRKKQDPSPKRHKHRNRSEKTDVGDETAQAVNDEKRLRKSRDQCTGINTVTESRPAPTAAAEEGTQQTVTVDELINLLPAEVRETDLAKETVQMILNTYTEKEDMLEAVEHITPGESWYPIIHERSYLFSNFEASLSDSCHIMEYQSNHFLDLALTDPVNTATDSLDEVFRNALREIAFEFNIVGDQGGDNTLEHPMFISASYLELTLLKKMRAHYISALGEDIVLFFTRAFPEERSKLSTLVAGSACAEYIKWLYSCLGVRVVKDFDRLMVPKPLGILKMRVWTNRRTQVQTDACFLNYLDSVYEAVKDKWYNLSDYEKQSSGTLMKFFCGEYSERMTSFLRTHGPFLEEMLRTSQLMAWFCFGVTADDIRGFRSMAASYYVLKSELKRNIKHMNPDVCWNYPLASFYMRP